MKRVEIRIKLQMPRQIRSTISLRNDLVYIIHVFRDIIIKSETMIEFGINENIIKNKMGKMCELRVVLKIIILYCDYRVVVLNYGFRYFLFLFVCFSRIYSIRDKTF